MKRRLTSLLPAIAVAVFAFVWLGRVSPPVFPINDDAIRDQLLVRDCTDLGFCHLLGAPSSFGGVYHGAVWIQLLTAVRLLGGDLSSQRIVVLVFLALSVATLFIVVWRWLRPSMALPAAVLLIGALSFDMPASLLINPSMAVFPDILTSAGLLCYGLSRQRRFLLMSAFTLGVAMSVHTASLSLVAPFLVVAALARPRAWRDVIPSIAIAAVTYAFPSSATLRANVMALAEHGRLFPVLAALLIVLLFALAFGSRFQRLSWSARTWVIGGIMILPFAVTLSWLVVAEQHHFSFIYVHPVLGPAVVLAAAVISVPFERVAGRARPLRWIPTAAASGVIAFVAVGLWRPVALAPSADAGEWNLAEAATVAEYAARGGWSYDDLILHLQGSGCRDLLAGMSVAAPAPRRAPGARRHQLQVIKAPRAAFAPIADVVPLGSNAALIREVESWLQPRALRACRIPVASGIAPLCATASPVAPDAYTPERFLFINWSFPRIERLDRQARPYIATYEIPLAPGAGEHRELTVTDSASPCGWRITRIDGVQVEGSLPSRRLRLHATGTGPGLVVFEKPFGTDGCPSGDIDTGYPPCVLETQPGDALQDLVGRS